MKWKNDVVLLGIALLLIAIGVVQIRSAKNELEETKSKLAVVEVSNTLLRASESISAESTKNQLEREQQLREKSDETVRTLQQLLQNNVCAKTRLPDSVLERLRTP